MTLVLDGPGGVQARASAALADALRDRFLVRAVLGRELIARDIREAARVWFWSWRDLVTCRHLRELLERSRERLLVGVEAGPGLLDDPGTLALVRRLAAQVFTADPALWPALHDAFLVPVHLLPVSASDPEWGAVCGRLLSAPPGRADEAALHAQDAQQWILRGEMAAAFAAAARALRLGPDQPGVVTDVARVLVAMGEQDKAGQLCRAFLRQRPDAAVVREMLVELAAV